MNSWSTWLWDRPSTFMVEHTGSSIISCIDISDTSSFSFSVLHSVSSGSVSTWSSLPTSIVKVWLLQHRWPAVRTQIAKSFIPTRFHLFTHCSPSVTTFTHIHISISSYHPNKARVNYFNGNMTMILQSSRFHIRIRLDERWNLTHVVRVLRWQNHIVEFDNNIFLRQRLYSLKSYWSI